MPVKKIYICLALCTLSLLHIEVFAAPMGRRSTKTLPTSSTSATLSLRPPEFRSWEVRTAPLALLASWLTFDLSYRLNDQFSTGPAVVLYNSDSSTPGAFTPNYKGTALGWQANYYLTSVRTRSWYLSARAYYDDYTSRGHAAKSVTSVKGLRADAFGGYQWRGFGLIWLSGLGFELRNYETVINYDPVNGFTPASSKEASAGIIPMAEFKMGYEF